MIWLALMPPGGVGNIFYEMLVNKCRTQRFTPACSIDLANIDGDWYPYTSKTVSYVSALERKFGCGLRNIQWQNNLDDLDQLCQAYEPQHVWVGTFHTKVFDDLKLLRPEIRTISVGYDQSQLALVKDKWAHWQTGLVFTNDHYRDLRQGYRAHEFKQSLLVNGSQQFGHEIEPARSSQADIEINIEDIFHEPSLASILTDLGADISEDAWRFYRRYIKYSG